MHPDIGETLADLPSSLMTAAGSGRAIDIALAPGLAAFEDLSALASAAAGLRDRFHGANIGYSRKVFIPLTRLCRDVCHYCVFSRVKPAPHRAFMTPDEVLAVARAGKSAGCKEALFTLGDKPEARFRFVRNELGELGHDSTLSYLKEMAGLVLRETGLLPHLNPGIMSEDEICELRTVSASMGLMLESTAERLGARGQVHYGSPDKLPAKRLAVIAAAGRQQVPITTGILIGIGERRDERVDTLLAIRRLHEEYGHIQEVIIQPFRPKHGTPMARVAAPAETELLWTISVARLILGGDFNVQTPPNLLRANVESAVAVGINDWGGISPVTLDHINPERPWPEISRLADQTAAAGKVLVERLAIYPAYAARPRRWLDPALQRRVLDEIDAAGFVRGDSWRAGRSTRLPSWPPSGRASAMRRIGDLDQVLARARRGETLAHSEIGRLFKVRGAAFRDVIAAANELRAAHVGPRVTYVVNRNINYTNICTFHCHFCAFSKGTYAAGVKERPYRIDLDEIQRRTVEAWDRGAIEVCLQGGIHPDYTGRTYLEICQAVHEAAPDIHIHAFSPLEIWHGAKTTGRSIAAFLEQLARAGLASLPGTAAEILNDEVRQVICPDKITAGTWLEIMGAAHEVGLPTTATIMFGHVEAPHHWTEHLLRVRRLQEQTAGFTEFVPLPYVAERSPIYLKGRARPGPTYREALLMHAVSRLVLHPVIKNIQTSWVKMGPEGAAACLDAGANDIGGTLMNESITRAAGAAHGQEMTPTRIGRLAASIGRASLERTTLYKSVEVGVDRSVENDDCRHLICFPPPDRTS